MSNKTKFEKYPHSKTGITVQLLCSVIGISMFTWAIIRNIEKSDQSTLILCVVVLLLFIWSLIVAIKRAFDWQNPDSRTTQHTKNYP